MAGTIESVRQAIRVLGCFDGSTPDLGITEISAMLGRPKSAVHRVVRTLEEAGFLEKDPVTRRYRIGLACFQAGSVYLKQHAVHRLAASVLEELSRESGHSSYLGVLSGMEIVIILAEEGTSPVRIVASPGDRFPAYACALGKAVLSQLPRDEVRRRLDGKTLKACTGATVALGRLMEELEVAESRSYSTSVGEVYTGTASVAAPVKDRRGATIGAICVSFPILGDVEVEVGRVAPVVVEKARKLSDLATAKGRWVFRSE
ncbi:MAG: IclR family transcriptional regulator [Firmicutes bacterium]|jgi:DNA-binding IclR family transcriptional regulator|nr:IclR family transcriptional regulator [Bacillota bacterium]